MARASAPPHAARRRAWSPLSPTAVEPALRSRGIGDSSERSSAAALVVLLALVVVTPWPFGGVGPLAAWLMTLVALGTALGVVLAQARRGHGRLPGGTLWPLAGMLALAVLQLVPLPAGLHAWLAPGSAAVWHPPEPAAAAVLGEGSRPISIHPEATRRWLAFAGGLVALAALAAPSLRDRRRALRACLVVVGSGLIVSLYALVARAVFGPLLFGRWPVPTVSPFGPFVSKNHFAGYVEMAALLALGLAVGLGDDARRASAGRGWMQGPEAARVVLAYGAAVAMGLAVLVSLSRGGVTSLATGAVAFASIRVFLRRRARARSRMLLGLAVTALLVGSLATVLPAEAKRRVLSLAGIASDDSGAFRLRLWHDALRVARTSPLAGHGMATFADALPSRKTVPLDMRIEHAENDYLELLADGGGLALLGLLAAILLGGPHLLRGLVEQQDRRLRGMGLGAITGLFALLVHSAFDFNLRIPSNALLFAFLAALAVAACGGEPRAVGRRSLAAAALVLASASVLAAALPSPGGAVSQVEEVRRLLAARVPLGLRWAQADAALVCHLRGRPADAEAWVLLGWVRAVRADRAQGAALARYGAGLDSKRRSLRQEADRLGRFVNADRN